MTLFADIRLAWHAARDARRLYRRLDAESQMFEWPPVVDVAPADEPETLNGVPTSRTQLGEILF